MLMFCCSKPAWAVAFLIACKERKLRNYQYISINTLDVAVHNMIFIVKYSQSYGFAYEPINILLVICFFYTHKDEHSCFDF